MARPIKAKGLERLRRALDAIPKLKNLKYRSPEFDKWQRNTEVAITNTFESKSAHIGDFKNIRFSPAPAYFEPPESERQEVYVKGLESAAAVLESMIEEIEEYWSDENQTPTQPIDQSDISALDSERIDKRSSSNRVFVIHGHDESARRTVARFLERLDLEPVILHEQPNKGRTIIEKFEEHAQVGFAVVLLTPDDVGALADDKKNQKPRARQNVIFEFGYFIGKLGRERVCTLVKGNVETPSDYDGVIYIPLDGSDGWKLRLIRELKSVGFNVDANQVL